METGGFDRIEKAEDKYRMYSGIQLQLFIS